MRKTNTHSKIFKVFFAFLFMVLTIATPVYIQKSASSELKAVISLPSELRPDYSPDVKVEANGKQGVEIVYANYILQMLAGSLLFLAGPVAVLVIAIAGLRYATSHGNQTMMDGAKKTLEYAVIGLIVIILSFAIIRAIIGTIISAT